MDELGLGEAYRDITVFGDEHSAERIGNVGVNVAGTPAMIALLETAAHKVLRPHLGAHQGRAGINVSVDHLAAAPIGAEIVASAAVKSVDGIRVTFDVEAHWNDILLMAGTHRRAVVDLERFLATLPQLPK